MSHSDSSSAASVDSYDDCEMSQGVYAQQQQQQDGMADMMSKILNQSVGAKIPVLAKRKSNIVKEIEQDKAELLRLKRQKAERKAEKTKQMVVPDQTTADFERQLRKLATRGVVALFNAISKQKREKAAEQAEKEAAKIAVNKAAAPGLVTDKSSSLKRKANEAQNSDSNGRSSSDDNDDDDRNRDRTKSQRAKSKPPSSQKSGWTALKDDYMIDNDLLLKNWDKAAIDDDDNHGDDDDENSD